MVVVHNLFRSKDQEQIKRKLNEAFLQLVLMKSK